MINLLKELMELFFDMLNHQKGSLFLVVFLNVISLAAKLGAVLLVAAAIYFLRNEGNVSFFNYTLNIEINTYLLVCIGLFLTLLAVIETHSRYLSTKRARMLGKASTISTQERLLSALFELRPSHLTAQEANDRLNLQISDLTRVPLHVGLSQQTLATLVSPVLQAITSFVIILIVDYRIALLGILALFIGMPLLQKMSTKVQINSREFFGEKSANMGKESVGILHSLLSQYGSLSRDSIKSIWLKEDNHKHSFLAALDNNLLANSRSANFMGIISAIGQGVIFALMLYYYFYAEFPLELIIVLLAAFSFFFSACKQCVAFVTKLLIYRPQYKNYLEHMVAPESSAAVRVDPPRENNKAGLYVLAAEGGRDKFNILQTIGRFNDAGEFSASNTYFVDKEFRFLEGMSVGQHIPDLSETTGSVRDFFDSHDVFQRDSINSKTIMDNHAWAQLSNLERLVLRLGNVLLLEQFSRVFLSSSIVQSLNQESKQLIELLSEKHRLFVVTSSYQDIATFANKYQVNSYGTLLLDNSLEWFEDITSLENSPNFAQFKSNSNNKDIVDPHISTDDPSLSFL